MKNEALEMITSTLSGPDIDFEVLPYPADDIAEPGFYYNPASLSIEHWSLPCPYNAPLASHASNPLGLIRDGFQSVLGLEDSDHLINIMKIWDNHLKKYGVMK